MSVVIGNFGNFRPAAFHNSGSGLSGLVSQSSENGFNIPVAPESSVDEQGNQLYPEGSVQAEFTAQKPTDEVVSKIHDHVFDASKFDALTSSEGMNVQGIGTVFLERTGSYEDLKAQSENSVTEWCLLKVTGEDGDKFYLNTAETVRYLMWSNAVKLNAEDILRGQTVLDVVQSDMLPGELTQLATHSLLG